MNKVLIVDDDRDFLSVLKDVLDEEGYEVYYAGDGMEAIQEFKRTLPDIVLLDHNMPNMPGITALKILKDLQPEVPIIIMTGSREQGLFVKALEYGADGLIMKPPDFPQLVEIVRANLDKVA